MISIFGDESADDEKKRVFAVGIVFGTQEQWDNLELKWVARTGGMPFHAADCDSDRGAYRDKAHSENKSLYKDLTTLLRDSGLYGWGSVMDLQKYHEAMPRTLPNHPHYHCFCNALLWVAGFVKNTLKDDSLKLTFDRRLEIEYNSTSIYNYLSQLPEWEGQPMMREEFGFSSVKDVGIQAADLWARELFKHLDNQAYNRPIRKSFEALASTARFGGEFYIDEFYKGWKAMLDQVENSQVGPFKTNLYRTWLAGKGILDSIDSRSRFMIQYDALQREEGNEEHFMDLKWENTENHNSNDRRPYGVPELPERNENGSEGEEGTDKTKDKG